MSINFVNSSPNFKCTVTKKTYTVRGNVNCNVIFVIYLVTCTNCKEQYVGSTNKFKPRVRGHKSDNKHNKTFCGVAKHFNERCKHPQLGANGYFSIQIIEVVPNHLRNDFHMLRREQYWHAQMFVITHGMNSTDDWFSSERKGHRK